MPARRRSARLGTLLATLLLAAGCGSTEPEPLEAMKPEVPADLCATVPAAARGEPDHQLQHRRDRQPHRGLLAALPRRRPPRWCTPWSPGCRPTTTTPRPTVLESQCDAIDRAEFREQSGFQPQGADQACAASGKVDGADSATVAAVHRARGRHRAAELAAAGQGARARPRPGDARGRPQLTGRLLTGTRTRTMSGTPAVPWHRPMSGRDPDEDHRASTPLELFFDLCFVVAVAAAAATLHHDLAEGHLSGLAGYAMVFFAIWWAWVNYSWFASAYDNDDISFRLLTFVIMTGVLVLAAGAPRAAGSDHDFRLIVVGYLIMRVAMIPLWLRVAREHPAARGTALRYVVAILVIQALWVLRTILFAHGTMSWVSFLVLVVLEMATPLLGRAPPDDALAPAPHRRALRAVHDHRPGRGDPGHHRGDRRHPRRPRRGRPAGPADRGLAVPGVLDVVGLLQAADGRLAAQGDVVRLRLRALPRVRLGGGGRRLPGDARRRRGAPRPHREPHRRAPPGHGRQRLPAGDRGPAQPG